MTAGRALITGGAGFIGTNLAHRLLLGGTDVVVLDDLSRPGVEDNLRWLLDTHPRGLELAEGDVRDAELLGRALRGVRNVYHLAAQVAVTTSLERPRQDFGVNLAGTLEVLEAIRALPDPPSLLFTSTNKVYGCLEDVTVGLRGDRYEPSDPVLSCEGLSERRSLSFASPYGCSKGAADQYVLDYARSFGLPTVVFRMSCIYGPHQQGNEDQGWVAHFARQVMQSKEVTIYGDGAQVRDLLYVEDLLDAMQLATADITSLSGRAFNIGGGPANSASLVEVLDILGELHGSPPPTERGDWRVGDQRWYVSDTTSFREATGWQPKFGVAEGIGRLWSWLRDQELPLPLGEHR